MKEFTDPEVVSYNQDDLMAEMVFTAIDYNQGT